MIDTDVLIWYLKGNEKAQKIIQINENISNRAMFFVEDYFLSHSMELADAIIAATALEYREILLTANDKH